MSAAISYSALHPSSNTATATPLCVDLDGTILATDLLHECLVRLLSRPWLFLLLPFWLLRGKAVLKRELAKRVELDSAALPYRRDLLQWIRAEHAEGRPIFLVTGSDQKFADQISAHLGLFEGAFGSDGTVNLTSKRKASFLMKRFGGGGFDYVGDSKADLAVWREARYAITANRKVAAQADKIASVTRSFESPRVTPKVIVKAIRVRQWIKNILVFLPLVTAHRIFDLHAFRHAMIAFFAISFSASAIYVVNDLLDLDSDRLHATKCKRPFASGVLPVLWGFFLFPALLACATVLASFLPIEARFVIATYIATTLLYSFYLKRKMLVDVFALAFLYTMRVILGCAATGITCSAWLISFSIFLFTSLAFCKRAAELFNARKLQRENAKGRDYFVWDFNQVNTFGVTSGYLAAIVLANYIHSEQVAVLYRSPVWLWVLVPLLVYWVSRTWILTSRGAMQEDPIVFALRDRVTYICAAISGAALFLATTTHVGIPGVSQ